MFTSEIRLSPAPSHLRARTALLSSLLSSAALLFVTTPAWSQSSTLDPVVVSPPKPQTATRQGGDQQGALRRAKRAARNTAAKPVPAPVNEPAPTPLNSNVVAGSASRLGLTAHEMPASVEIIGQNTMREQGYRTTTESRGGRGRRPLGRCGRLARGLLHARLHRQRSDRALQRHLDRPARHHLAHHGHGQSSSRSKSSRVRRRSCRALARSAAPSTM